MLSNKILLRGRQLLLGVRPRQLSNELENGPPDDSSSILRRIKLELEADKQRLHQRKRDYLGERPGDWNSKLKLFANQEQTSDFIVMMQQPWDFSPKGIREMWNKRKQRTERALQQFVSDRHEILGPELAAAHFLLYRGGAVKFMNDHRWWRADENGEFDLPRTFHPSYKVEAIRCDDMTLYYEGLENIRCLHHLKFLSFHNVHQFDDWCLDRVSGSEFVQLEVLDISATNCTAKGLSCLYRLPSLKLLIMDDPKSSLEKELSVSMLQEVVPELKIVGGETVHQKD